MNEDHCLLAFRPHRLCRTCQWLVCPTIRAKLSGWRKEEGFLQPSSCRQVEDTGTSVGLRARGHLMVGITLLVFRSLILFRCNLISRGWIIPKLSELIQTVPNKMQLWSSVFNKTVEKAAGNSVGQSPFNLAFRLLGYKGKVLMSQLLQPALIGDLERSGGVKHPRISGGTSGLTKYISDGK